MWCCWISPGHNLAGGGWMGLNSLPHIPALLTISDRPANNLL
jgi:hypothetical protein